MKIHIEALTFEAIIGLLEHERVTPQRVVVDLEASYSYTPGVFINYATLSTLIKELITTSKFELLEDALLTLEQNIKREYPAIDSLSLKITKPDILSECQVAVSNKWHY